MRHLRLRAVGVVELAQLALTATDCVQELLDPLDGLFFGVRLNNGEPTHYLFRLGERTVGHRQFVSGESDRAPSAEGMQPSVASR